MHKGDDFYTGYAENAIYNEKLHDYLVFHGADQDGGRLATVVNGQLPLVSTAVVTEAQFRQTQSYECQKQRFCTLDREGEPARWYASLEFQANDFDKVDSQTRGEIAARLALTMKRPSKT
jgi:hypothetical protein